MRKSMGYAAAYGYRIRFQIGIQEALNRGVEVIHVAMQNGSLHPIFPPNASFCHHFLGVGYIIHQVHWFVNRFRQFYW